MGLLQLSQSCKNDECYTHRQTDRQTDRQTNSKMAPCTHPGTSREVNEARRPHTCSRQCAFEEKRKKRKKRKNPAPPKTHHEIHSSPASATTSRRRATKHVPRVSPYSPASMDPGFVEIGLEQLSSQSVKTTNVTHADTDRQTDRLIK